VHDATRSYNDEAKQSTTVYEPLARDVLRIKKYANGFIGCPLRYKILMTRHNLSSQISWLLSHQVTPFTGVHPIAPADSRAAEIISVEEFLEEPFEEEISRLAPSSTQNRRVPHTVNVVQDFKLPALPPSTSAKLQVIEPTETWEDNSMGKLVSSSKPPRPGLMSQHQLATPASTTSSTAASSTLKQGYATFLRENNSGQCIEYKISE